MFPWPYWNHYFPATLQIERGFERRTKYSFYQMSFRNIFQALQRREKKRKIKIECWPILSAALSIKTFNNRYHVSLVISFTFKLKHYGIYLFKSPLANEWLPVITATFVEIVTKSSTFLNYLNFCEAFKFRITPNVTVRPLPPLPLPPPPSPKPIHLNDNSPGTA